MSFPKPNARRALNMNRQSRESNAFSKSRLIFCIQIVYQVINQPNVITHVSAGNETCPSSSIVSSSHEISFTHVHLHITPVPSRTMTVTKCVKTWSQAHENTVTLTRTYVSRQKCPKKQEGRQRRDRSEKT